MAELPPEHLPIVDFSGTATLEELKPKKGKKEPLESSSSNPNAPATAVPVGGTNSRRRTSIVYRSAPEPSRRYNPPRDRPSVSKRSDRTAKGMPHERVSTADLLRSRREARHPTSPPPRTEKELAVMDKLNITYPTTPPPASGSVHPAPGGTSERGWSGIQFPCPGGDHVIEKLGGVVTPTRSHRTLPTQLSPLRRPSPQRSTTPGGGGTAEPRPATGVNVSGAVTPQGKESTSFAPNKVPRGLRKARTTAAGVPLQDVTELDVALVPDQDARTHLQVMVEMRDSMHRVDRILGLLSRNQPMPTEYSDEDYTTEKRIDPAHIDELKEVIEVLLRDLARQTNQLKEQELADQRKDIVVKDAKNEAYQATTRMEKLASESQSLVEEVASSKDQVATLEQRVRLLERQLYEAEERAKKAEAAASALAEVAAKLKKAAEESTKGPVVSANTIGGTFEAASLLAETSIKLLPSRYTDAPSGNVFVICTSIQSAEDLWQNFPKDMPYAVSAHNRVVRDAIADSHGYEVKSVGEEFMAVFKELADVCSFVSKVHEEMVDQCWPEPLSEHPDCATVEWSSHSDDECSSPLTPASPASKKASMNRSKGEEGRPPFLWGGLRVRMGLHYGSVIMHADPITGGADYMGPVVNRALLLRRISLGGMVATSKEVYSLIQKIPKLAAKQSLTFHCALPTREVGTEELVYCMLPAKLEDRLTDIQTKVREAAKAAGVEQPMATGSGLNEEDQPSELEAMLGTFRKREITGALVTGDGVISATECTSAEEGEAAVRTSGLPSGTIAFCVVRFDHYEHFKLRLKERDLQVLVDIFQDTVRMCLVPYGGIVVSMQDSSAFAVFHSAEAAVKSTMYIDTELMNAPWPEDLMKSYEAELQSIRWRGTEIFRGVRASCGVHPCAATPRYDPMTKTVGYSGENALIAVRLAELSKGGQTLMTERCCGEVLAHLDPLPLIIQLTLPESAAGNYKELQSLCVIQNRQYVGRLFYYRDMKNHETAKDSMDYRKFREEIAREDMKWARRATLVVPKASPTRLGEGDTESGGPSLLYRQHDLHNAQELATHFARRISANGPADPAVVQLESLEHNCMLLEDKYYDGQTAELFPLLLDLTDLRGVLPMPYNPDAEHLDVALERNAELADDAEKILEAELDRIKGAKAATRGGVGSPVLRGKQALEAQRQRKAFSSLEEEVAELREKFAEVQLDVLGLHKDLRFFLNLVRSWLDALIDANKIQLSEEDVVFRFLQHHRSTVELKARGVPERKAQEEWREILSVSLEVEGEEVFSREPFKLCRSMIGHLAKHFVYLRGFARRMKVKQAKSTGAAL